MMPNKFRKYKKPSVSMDEVKELQAKRREHKAKMQAYRKAKHAALIVKHGLPPIVIISSGVNRWWLHPAGIEQTHKFSGNINGIYWVLKGVRGGTAEEAIRNHGHEVYRFDK
jgi:hypothetical protein